MGNKKTSTPFLLVLGLSIVFYTWLAAQIPYGWDDWTWGLPMGMERFLTASINCRYAGNLVEIIITRSLLCKDIIMGLCFALLPASFFAVLRQVYGRSASPCLLLILANLLLLCMPRNIWRQTYGWIAGFANYVPSMLLLLLCHGVLLRRREGEKPGVPRLLGAFALGLTAQLFLENLALYIFASALLFFIIRWVQNKKPDRVLAAFFVGAAIGFCVMFASSLYLELFQKGYTLDYTRELSFSMDEGLAQKAIHTLVRFAGYFTQLWNRSFILSAAILAALTLSFGKGRRRGILAVINGAFALYFIATGIFGDLPLGSETLTAYFAHGMGFAYFCLVAVECLLLFWRSDRRRLFVLLFVWLSAPAIVAPLAVTFTDGGRMYFAPYVLELEFLLLLCAPLTERLSDKSGRAVTAVIGAVLCLLCVNFALVYREIGSVDRERQAIIAAARPGETIFLPEYPHEEYNWVTDPPSVDWYTPEYMDYFKAFFGIPENVEVEFESCQVNEKTLDSPTA